MDKSLLKLALEKQSTYCIEEAISDLINKAIYIYGAGSFGEETYCLLKKFHIPLSGFLDKNANFIKVKQDTKVYTLEDSAIVDKENATVVFAVVMDKDERRTVIKAIQSIGYKRVIEAQSLRCLLVDFKRDSVFDAFEYLKSQENNIYAVADLFEDEKSKNIYISNVYSHITRDYSKCGLYEENMNEQYFPKDIHFYKGYSHFIDCGGYIGDTVLQLISRPEMKHIVSFEPYIENFIKLSDTCDNFIRDENLMITLFPCAVSDRVGITKFAGTGGSGSISDTGDEIIQSIALDKALKNIPVTYIKMDIEGEELKALQGAKKMIENQKPDLAICVYHCISHLWEIPLYIKKINPDYKLYLRSYNAFTMETVLYATHDGRK